MVDRTLTQPQHERLSFVEFDYGPMDAKVAGWFDNGQATSKANAGPVVRLPDGSNRWVTRQGVLRQVPA